MIQGISRQHHHQHQRRQQHQRPIVTNGIPISITSSSFLLLLLVVLFSLLDHDTISNITTIIPCVQGRQHESSSSSLLSSSLSTFQHNHHRHNPHPLSRKRAFHTKSSLVASSSSLKVQKQHPLLFLYPNHHHDIHSSNFLPQNMITDVSAANLPLSTSISTSTTIVPTSSIFSSSSGGLLDHFITSTTNMIIATATELESTTTTSDSMIDTYNNVNIGMLSPEMTLFVFVIGVVPFGIATYEFWRRIAIGATFGTSSDSIVISTTATIGEDNNPTSSRGQRTLGSGALLIAYLLFAIAAGILSLSIYSVVSTGIVSINQ